MRVVNRATLVAIFCLITSSGWAQALTVKLDDPAGDIRRGVDVIEVELTFSPVSGAYVIRVRTTPEQPFGDQYVRLNFNLFNPDAPADSRVFSDSLNDHPVDHDCLGPSFPLHVRAGSREYPLFGKSDILKKWKAGDRVAGSDRFAATDTSATRQIVVDVVRYREDSPHSPISFFSGVGPAGAHGFPQDPGDRIESVGVLRGVSTLAGLPLQYGKFGMGGFFHDYEQYPEQYPRTTRSFMGPMAHSVSESGQIEIAQTFATPLPNGTTETIKGTATTMNDGTTLAAQATVSSQNLRPPAALARACSAVIHFVQAQLAPGSPTSANLFLRILIQGAARARSSNQAYGTAVVGTQPTNLKTFTSSGSQNRRVTVDLGKIDLRQPFNIILAVVAGAAAFSERNIATSESNLTVVLEEVRLTSGSQNSKPIPILGFTSKTGLDLKLQNGFGVPASLPKQ
jgi:hypothetical protein